MFARGSTPGSRCAVISPCASRARRARPCGRRSWFRSARSSVRALAPRRSRCRDRTLRGSRGSSQRDRLCPEPSAPEAVAYMQQGRRWPRQSRNACPLPYPRIRRGKIPVLASVRRSASNPRPRQEPRARARVIRVRLRVRVETESDSGASDSSPDPNRVRLRVPRPKLRARVRLRVRTRVRVRVRLRVRTRVRVRVRLRNRVRVRVRVDVERRDHEIKKRRQRRGPEGPVPGYCRWRLKSIPPRRSRWAASEGDGSQP